MEVDPRIKASAVFIADLDLCQLFLQRDGDVDWFVLVPRRPELVNWHDLTNEDLSLLNAEIKLVSKKLTLFCSPTKVNVANLGNIVPQFHVHVIARYTTDRTWPGPIWGSAPTRPFQEEERLAFWQDKFRDQQ